MSPLLHPPHCCAGDEGKTSSVAVAGAEEQEGAPQQPLSKRAAHKLELQKKWQAKKEAKQRAKQKRREAAQQQQRQQEGGTGVGDANQGPAPKGERRKKEDKKGKGEKEQQEHGGAQGAEPADVSAWRAFALHPSLEQALAQMVGCRCFSPVPGRGCWACLEFRRRLQGPMGRGSYTHSWLCSVCTLECASRLLQGTQQNPRGSFAQQLESTVTRCCAPLVACCTSCHHDSGHHSMQSVMRRDFPRSTCLQRFSTPTPIQAAALPPAINDRVDVIGAAQTGSGKTLAYGLPIMQQLLQVWGRCVFRSFASRYWIGLFRCVLVQSL